MDLTIEIPQHACAVVIRPLAERSAKAGEAEYDSWKPDVAEYDSWTAAFSPRVARSRSY